MILTAYQVACLAVVGIVALSFLLIWVIAMIVIGIARWVDYQIMRHRHDVG